MAETPSPVYEHEHTLFTEEEFWKRFQNFYMIFVYFDDPEQQPDITKFLKQNYPELSRRLVKRMEEIPRYPEIIPTDIGAELIPLLYDVYLKLRQEGGFSNKELGLTYW